MIILRSLAAVDSKRQTCSLAPSSPLPPYWLNAQDHTGNARGYAPFLGNDFTFPVYRNVKSAPYNARGDGSADDVTALQNAINADPIAGNRYRRGVSIRPATVYVPGGTYMLSRSLDMRLNTILVGDPNNPPVFKATADFNGDALIHGYDDAANDPTTAFFVAIKNIVLDTTNIDRTGVVTALHWGVSQACHLTNLKIIMPNSSTGHTGINMERGSAIAVNDVTISGGFVGLRVNNQQVNIKNFNFQFCTTAILFGGGKTALIQGATIDTCGTGIDSTNSGELGSLVILDSTVTDSGPVVRFHDSSNDGGSRNSQLVIENLVHSGVNPIAVDHKGITRLGSTGFVDTWIWGNVIPGTYTSGQSITTNRPAGLLVGGKYFTKAQPTYGQYSADKFVNVKAVTAFPVKGDGSTDDAAAINAILLANAANCKITYFPYGVYRVRSTIYIPPNSRIVGETWSVISGDGEKFWNPASPQPVVMVGRPGEVGIAEVQDMRFTVGDVLQGATILQVNMAGSRPGDVGFWNTVVTVGGTADSKVNYVCGGGNTAACKAAFALVHLTSTSSAYIENMWGWVADHSLESTPGQNSASQNIAVGRGLLVESVKPTWLTGTGFEHCTLYQYNFHNAQNVFAGLLQTETAYWQGEGTQQLAPAPWTALSPFGDPDFSWCNGGDAKCRMGLATNIDGGSNLFLYAAAFWTFFHGETQTRYDFPGTICGANCITNQIRVANAPKGLYWYGVGTRNTATVILDGRSNIQAVNVPGGWAGGPGPGSPGGVIAAYLQFSGSSLSRFVGNSTAS